VKIWHSSASLEVLSFHGPLTGESDSVGRCNRLLVATEKWMEASLLSFCEGGAAHVLTPGTAKTSSVPHSDRRTVALQLQLCDIDRRHLWTVSITGDHPSEFTRGESNEWSPLC